MEKTVSYSCISWLEDPFSPQTAEVTAHHFDLAMKMLLSWETDLHLFIFRLWYIVLFYSGDTAHAVYFLSTHSRDT